MKNNKNLKAIILGIILMVLAVAGATYAYFTATISNGDNGSSIIIRTGTLRLVYTDTEYINVSGVLPGESYSKVVTVTNEGNVPVYYHLVWIELLNELVTRNDLTMEISCSSNTDTCGGLSDTVVSESGETIPILYNVEIGMLETHTYTITLHFNETGSNQNDNQGKIISGKVGIIEARDLAVNLYGYVYDEEGDPMSSTIVELHSDPVSVVTDATGRYEFESIPLGSHTAYIKTSDGSSTITTTSLLLTQGKTTNINNTNVTLNSSRQSIGININVDPIDPIISLTQPTGTLAATGLYYMDSEYDWTDYYNYKQTITNITFDNKISIPGDAVSSWDASSNTDGSVMAYIKSDGVSGYDLHIQALDGVYAPINPGSLFSGYSKVTSISGLENLNTSNVTDMSYMFSNLDSIVSLNLSSFDTSKVTTMQSMFESLDSIELLNLSSFDTSKVTNMSYMFYGGGSYDSIAALDLDLHNFDTSKVTNFYNIFSSSNLIKSLNVSGWDLSGATSMSNMFYSSRHLETLNVTGMKTNTITNMSYAFRYCDKMTSLIGINTLDTSSVTDMNGIFGYSSALTSLVLTSWNTSKVTNINSMFEYMTNLITLNINGWDTSSVTSMSSTFSYLTNLKTLDISGFDFSSLTGKSLSGLFQYFEDLETVNISNIDTTGITDMSNMFHYCSKLTSIIGIESMDTSSVTNMYAMFDNCLALTTINLSNFVTTSVTNMYSMFYKCRSLTTLNLSNFVTTNVTNMSYMFSGCIGLTTISISNFDTSNVTNMGAMFAMVDSLTSLNLSNFNTSKVIDMDNMFWACSSLTSINVSSFNTSEVTDMSFLFEDCSSLTVIDLSNFNTSKLTNASGMFHNCSSLATLKLDIAAFDLVTNYSDMFAGVTTGINVSVLNSTSQTFINTRLTNAGITGTVTVG